MLAAVLRHPAVTLRVSAAIRHRGIRLWARGLPVIARRPVDTGRGLDQLESTGAGSSRAHWAPVTAPLTIRVAEAADVDSLLALVHSAYRGPSGREGWTSEADLIDGPRTTRALLAADVADPSITVLVAGDLLGCAAVTHEAGASTASFGLFAVRPGLQGGGVGSALLAAAEDHARERGATVMEMSSSTGARSSSPGTSAGATRGRARRRPFPYGAEGVGEPRDDDFRFAVLAKDLGR